MQTLNQAIRILQAGIRERFLTISRQKRVLLSFHQRYRQAGFVEYHFRPDQYVEATKRQQTLLM